MVEWQPSPQQDARESPLTSAVLVDEHGRTWRRHGPRSLDIRVVRRLTRKAGVLMVIGGAGGFHLRHVEPDARSTTWDAVRHRYAGVGGKVTGRPWPDEPVYDACEFRDDAGTALLYIEEHC